MIKAELRDYINRVLEAKQISADDVRDLRCRRLEDGLGSRAEAEALLALDRVLPAHESWGDALTALMVDFVVTPGDEDRSSSTSNSSRCFNRRRSVSSSLIV